MSKPHVSQLMVQKGFAPSVNVSCGCCDKGFKIYFMDKEHLEIAGVNATLTEWKEVLEPLLNGKYSE